MEKKKVTIAGPMAINGTTITLVIKSSLNCQPGGGNIFFSGIKQPIKVVVVLQSTRKAFDIEGSEIPIDQLLHEMPELADMLEKNS